MKRCRHCDKTKPLSDFSIRRDSPDGHRNQCRICERVQRRIYEAKWRAVNRDKTRATAARYVANHRAEEHQRWARYDEANREKRRLAMAKRRAENPNRNRELQRKWRAANPDKTRDYYYRYYASVRDPTRNTTTYIAMLLGDRCSYCSSRANHVDHITPRSHGGVHDWTNLTACCASCNPSKGNRSLMMWLATR